MFGEAKVKCPRCGRIWIVPQGQPDAECTCHLYCDYGFEIGDCVVTWPVNWSGQLGWPTGLAVEALDNSDHMYRAMGYCTTHSRYYYKDKVTVEVDWDAWLSNRAPKELRSSLGTY